MSDKQKPSSGDSKRNGDMPYSQETSLAIPAPHVINVPASRVSVVGAQAKPRHVHTDDSGAGLTFVMNVLRRWWPVAAPIGILIAGVAASGVWYFFERQYEAAAWLKIDVRQPYLAFENKEEDARSKTFFQTQIELIRSPLVLGPVVQRPEIAKLPEIQQKSDPIAYLAKQVRVMTVGESELFKIVYQSPSPDTSVAIVNAVTESYFKLRDQSDAERTQMVVDLLEKEKSNRLKEVIRMRQDLSDMTRQLTGRETFSSKQDNDSLQKNALVDLQGRLVTAQVEKAILAARIAASDRDIQGPALGAPGLTTTSSTANAGEAAFRDATIEKALLERPEVTKANEYILAKEARQKEIELRMKDGRNDPVYIQLSHEIAEDRLAIEGLKKSLRSTVEKQTDAMLLVRRSDRENAESTRRADELAHMRSELEGREILEQKLQAEYDKELRNVKKFSGNTLELEFKHDELTRAEKVFELIANRTLQLQTERMAPERVSLMHNAEVSKTPVEMYPLSRLGVAILGGFFLPFGLAFAWERWVRRVSDSTDLPTNQGLPVLGEIAYMPRRLPSPAKLGWRQNELELRVYQESIDNLQTSLRLSVDIGALRFIAVTSAVSDEGKTSVASQLAMSLSRSINERVLLIDGDMRSPDIHRIFQIDRDPGLAAVLGQQCDLSEAIVTTWSDRVHLLPAGTLTRNPLSLLAGDAWPNLLARIPAEYRYVVVDTPPVLAASEALILAKSTDASLICTIRDRSRTEQVLMVNKRLKEAGARPIGVVLSGMPTKSYLHRYGSYDYLANH